MKRLAQFLLKTIFFIFALGWVASCAEKRPEHVLAKQEMVSIMEELYIAEEKINHLALSRDSSRKVFTVMQSKLFENAGVNDTLFRKSFDYYMERPKELELIYTALVDTLQLREQRAPFRPDDQ